MAKLVALAAALLLCPPSALAWGGLGHEAICELAFLELDDTARQRVIALIRLDPEFPTFRASCNWPDRPRQRASEHFVNLPRDSTGLDDHECPMAEECVVRSRPLSFSSWNAIWQMILWPMSLQASAGVWPENTTGQASQPSKRPFQDLLTTNAWVDILDLHQKPDLLPWPSCRCRSHRTSKPGRCCTTSSSTATTS